MTSTFWLLSILAQVHPAPHPWEELALQSRHRIQTGVLLYRAERFSVDPKSGEFGSKPPKFLLRDRYIFDYRSGRMVNLERKRPTRALYRTPDGKLLSEKDPDGYRTLRIIINGEKCMTYEPTILEDGSKSGIAEAMLNEEGVGEICLGAIVDPLLWGMAPCHFGFYYDAELSSCLTRSDRTEMEVTDEMLDGFRTKRISFTRLDGVRYQIWIAKELDYAVLRIEMENPATQLGARVESTFKQYPQGDIWFPEKVLWTATKKGKVTAVEQLVLEEARFNTKIDSNMFTVAGLDPYPNTTFFEVDPPGGFTRVWDGEKLTRPGRKRTLQENREEKRSLWRWIVAGNLLFLALLLSFVLWRRHARKKITNSQENGE